MASFTDLAGKTIVATYGVEPESGEAYFQCSDDTTYKMFHSQSCCESVYLEDVVGDPEDLCALVISASWYTEEDPTDSDACFTFYNIQTSKGAITQRLLLH